MKIKSLALASAVALAGVGMTAVSAPAEAGVSGNIGMMSNYYFRGGNESDKATAFGGLDYEHDIGLYAGTWLADLGDGSGFEYDLYGGYANSFGGFSVLVGYTAYLYSEETVSEDGFTEVNLGLGYDFGPVALDAEHAIGTDEDAEQDYTFTAVTVSGAGLSLTYGTFGDEAEGSYTELGYGLESGDIGLDLAVGSQDNDAGGDEYLMFTVTKGFDLL